MKSVPHEHTNHGGFGAGWSQKKFDVGNVGYIKYAEQIDILML